MWCWQTYLICKLSADEVSKAHFDSTTIETTKIIIYNIYNKCWASRSRLSASPAQKIILIDIFIKQVEFHLLAWELCQDHLQKSQALNTSVHLPDSNLIDFKLNKSVFHLIKFIPDRVEVFFDDLTFEGHSSHTDLHIRVTFSLHHATH